MTSDEIGLAEVLGVKTHLLDALESNRLVLPSVCAEIPHTYAEDPHTCAEDPHTCAEEPQ